MPLSKSKIGRVYGWKPGRPSMHHKKFGIVYPAESLPPQVSALTAFIPAWDQGQLGSCTAHGTGRIWSHRYAIEKKTMNPPMPSRLFIYYNERAMEGSTDSDDGAAVSDGLQVLATLGAPVEADWPYDISQFAVKPPEAAYLDALQEVALQYENVDERNINAIKSALALGFPITFGTTLFESFEDSWSVPGVMPMPGPKEQMIGGHCMCIDGYDNSMQAFHVMNSWGTGWGMSGAFWMPYANLVNCSDMWILKAIK